jgi:hypothetical protein
LKLREDCSFPPFSVSFTAIFFIFSSDFQKIFDVLTFVAKSIDDSLTHGLIGSLDEYFKPKVEAPRNRISRKQEIETLTNERGSTACSIPKE